MDKSDLSKNCIMSTTQWSFLLTFNGEAAPTQAHTVAENIHYRMAISSDDEAASAKNEHAVPEVHTPKNNQWETHQR